MKKMNAHPKLWPWLMVASLSALTAACGGGNDGNDGGRAPILGTGDVNLVTSPTVAVFAPLANATGVPLATRTVTATFSKAMDPATLTPASFTLACPAPTAINGGVVTYLASSQTATLTFPVASTLPASALCTATVSTAAKDSSGLALVNPSTWLFTTAAAPDTTAPTVASTAIADSASNVAIDTQVAATFSEAMNPLSLTNTNFALTEAVSGAVVPGNVSYSGVNATFVPQNVLALNTRYIVTVKGGVGGVADISGNALQSAKVWSFTTANAAVLPATIDLISASTYGTLGGTAGMTNTGTLTQVNGNIGTIATGTSLISGFHDTAGDIYTETPANIGAVSGKILTCTNSVTGPTSAGVNAPSCTLATQARLDAQTAYNALVAKPVGGASPAPGANLAGLTLQAGTYVAPGGSFMIQGGNLTLDAQGDANATWVFQMATTLTLGGPGAAFPQSIILAGGAQAKNVFWQVGSFATINAAGGGTMVGTVISQAGAAISTAGNTNIVTFNGRVLSLGASVTLVNTVVNVPAP